MYCPRCGQMNEASARFCATCGNDLDEVRAQWQSGSTYDPQTGQATGGQQYQQPYQGAQHYQQHYQRPGAMPHVPSHLGWAIATLVLCFWPTGIAAVVYASQVNTRLSAGDYHGALESSRKAKMWSWISFGIGISWIVIALILVILANTTLLFY